MALALGVLLLTAAVLAAPSVWRAARRAVRDATRGSRPGELLELTDPGRERRAEQRARELLRSCVNEEEWAMYRDLGFLRVLGRGTEGARYAYLIYPHRPITAYVPETGRLLSEYCVEFPDLAGALGGHGTKLPASDDVLAKWMALTGDEHRLIKDANMHLPGRQLDPARVRRDLWRLQQWERERARQSPAGSGSVEAQQR